jgi:hypothetical protein
MALPRSRRFADGSTGRWPRAGRVWPSRACQVLRAAGVLRSMHIAYLGITILVALANSYAASLNFAGAESVKVVAGHVQVSQKWMIPFGILLASGAVGLLVGFAVPALGIAAAIGLVLYFICALSAHIRVRDSQIAGAVSFLMLAVAALIAALAYHNHW